MTYEITYYIHLDAHYTLSRAEAEATFPAIKENILERFPGSVVYIEYVNSTGASKKIEIDSLDDRDIDPWSSEYEYVSEFVRNVASDAIEAAEMAK